MIDRLLIENYALIDKLDLKFEKGLIIITGETGAGKSIMLDALGLLLGERADSKAIADKTRKTLVEAQFSDIPEFLREIFISNDLDFDKELLIVRREITPAGRSRAFINDTPVTLQTLSEITTHLIDIHSQHNNTSLQQNERQLALIDDFSEINSLLLHYKELFSKYADLRRRIKKIKLDIDKQNEKKEFLAFRLEQLEKIKPKEGELAKIEKEFDFLSDADQIKSDLEESFFILEESDNSILSQLEQVESLLNGTDVSILNDDEETDLSERLNAVKIELRDISESIGSALERVDANPARLERLSGRMHQIYDAIKRFKVKNEEELVALYHDLIKESENMGGKDDELSQLEKESKSLASEIKNLADEISDYRKAGAEKFIEKLIKQARPLGLPNLKIEAEINKGKLTSEGQDNLQLLCSFNKNHDLQPLSNVASGGEISRLMLSIKSILSDKREMPTIIFDEVDTGVSGEIADKMGNMMKEMSNRLQVIAITHLPQVAAKGNTHLKVYKKDNDVKTVSNVKILTPEERVTEIASMLSGQKVNSAAIENAKILMEGK